MVKKTTCHGCTRRCGLLVTLEDGKPIDLKGDRSQPMSRGFFCPRGKAMVMEQPFDPLRLKYPLKRMGERGEGQWKRISWDQALDEIADKLKKTIAEYGPESVVGSFDCMISTTFASRRFLRELGSPNEISMGGRSATPTASRSKVLFMARTRSATGPTHNVRLFGGAILRYPSPSGSATSKKAKRKAAKSLPSIRSVPSALRWPISGCKFGPVPMAP